MNKAAIGLGLVLAGVIGFGGIAAYQSHNLGNKATQNNLAKVVQDVSVHGKNKDFKLDDIKFIDSKVIDHDGSKVISTRIQNDSDRKIAGIKYTYDIDGQVVVLETSQELNPGTTSELTGAIIKGKTNLKDSELIKVNVNFVDSKNEVSNLEFAKNA
ncbi:MAG: hypothetical protein ACRCWM_08990 [Sarcina sp.]